MMENLWRPDMFKRWRIYKHELKYPPYTDDFFREHCDNCGKIYEEYFNIEPRICPECLLKGSESNT